MAEIIETPRAKTIRLVGQIGRDDAVALASVQALIDLLVPRGFFTEQEFYNAVSARLEDRQED